MGAGLGFKTFVTGDVLTAGDTNGYLMQGVWVFADATARDAAVTSPQEGNMCYLKSTDAVQYYSGSAWTAVGGSAGFTGALATRATAQSISSATFTAFLFTGESFDTSGFHDNATNPSRMTIPAGKGGYYQVNFQISMSGTSGRLIAQLRKNGTTTAIWENGNNSSLQGFKGSQIVSVAAADYLELFIYQGSGSTQNNDADAASNQFGITYLGA